MRPGRTHRVNHAPQGVTSKTAQIMRHFATHKTIFPPLTTEHTETTEKNFPIFFHRTVCIVYTINRVLSSEKFSPPENFLTGANPQIPQIFFSCLLSPVPLLYSLAPSGARLISSSLASSGLSCPSCVYLIGWSYLWLKNRPLRVDICSVRDLTSQPRAAVPHRRARRTRRVE